MSHLYSIFHVRDVDGGFGDAVTNKEFIGLVECTEQELEDFLDEWNKPRVYDRPYMSLWEHKIIAEREEILEIKGLQPYDPRTKDWPSIPEDLYQGATWNAEKQTWMDYDYETGEWYDLYENKE